MKIYTNIVISQKVNFDEICHTGDFGDEISIQLVLGLGLCENPFSEFSEQSSVIQLLIYLSVQNVVIYGIR